MKIYTRTGDNGDTHLLFGEKVSKDNIRCEVYGLLDTVNSYLGMARAVINDKYITLKGESGVIVKPWDRDDGQYNWWVKLKFTVDNTEYTSRIPYKESDLRIK